MLFFPDLLLFGNNRIFKDGSHSTSTKSTLANLPAFIDNGVENVLILLGPLSQTALDDIVAKLIQQEERHIGRNVLTYKADLFRRVGIVNDLLSRPGAILVDANGGQEGRDLFQHLEFGLLRAMLKQLLNDSVANVIYRKSAHEFSECLKPCLVDTHTQHTTAQFNNFLHAFTSDHLHVFQRVLFIVFQLLSHFTQTKRLQLSVRA